jgi:DNA-directed RNA polymerase specialized sigma24 family protein
LDYIRFKDAKKNQWQTSDYIEESEEEDMQYNSYYLERIEALKECIQKTLQSQDQQIVEMCVMYDFSSGEVSAETGLKPDNVRKRLSRGLKKVKDKCRQIWFLEQVK